MKTINVIMILTITNLFFYFLPCNLSFSAVADSDIAIEDNKRSKNTFVMIHFEAGHKGRLDNNLPIVIPEKYRTMDFGWQEYLYETAVKLVHKADDYGFHLTLAFNPQWAEYILLDSAKIETVRQWKERGHEIAFHHHPLNHPDWNGYSNDSNAKSNPILFLGNVDIGLDYIKKLATPTRITTAMIGGLPIDLPQSYKITDESLIFAGGNQYRSFEKYGNLRSLRPYKIIKQNGVEIIWVTHRELTTVLNDFTLKEALDIFKKEYNNIQRDEIYGIVFHCFDYLEAEDIYNNWFDFIKNNGDRIRSIKEVISDYEYDIPIQNAIKTKLQQKKVKNYLRTKTFKRDRKIQNRYKSNKILRNNYR